MNRAAIRRQLGWDLLAAHERAAQAARSQAQVALSDRLARTASLRRCLQQDGVKVRAA